MSVTGATRATVAQLWGDIADLRERSGMALEVDRSNVDAFRVEVKATPFWIAAAGGILLAVASVKSLRAVEALGALLFLLGLILFFVVAVQRARMEGIGTRAALGRGVRDALRFGWHLMP